MKILGIESSCDETAAAVVRGGKDGVEVLSNVVSSQIEIHQKYGGVVPEAAAREHVLNILPVVNEALEKAGVRAMPKTDFGCQKAGFSEDIDVIAVSVGPGLITSLIVGVETARVLSYAWNVPVIGVNHIEGHICANFIGANPKSQITNPKQTPNPKSQSLDNIFPAIVLTVSGGHTMIVLMNGHGKYKVVGETRDDAAGEAFDKAAKLLGIGYPGGPAVAEYAERFIKQRSEIYNFQFPIFNKIPNPKLKLPRPMMYSKDYDFSFSGLKTALLYEIRKDKNYKQRIPEYCYEFQQAAIDVLIHKTIKAALKYNAKTVMLAGGVSANSELRAQMGEAAQNQLPNSQFLIPAPQYTTDNAAMIAAAGYYRALRKDFTPWGKLRVDANLELM